MSFVKSKEVKAAIILAAATIIAGALALLSPNSTVQKNASVGASGYAPTIQDYINAGYGHGGGGGGPCGGGGGAPAGPYGPGGNGGNGGDCSGMTIEVRQ